MGPVVELATSSPDQTRALAAALARQLGPGDVVALTGELGAGKTCFVQGAAAALGVADRVTSPSFILRRDYVGRVPVIHLDIYRLDTYREVLELGHGQDAADAAVTFIEWADAASPLLPAGHLEVELRLEWPAGDSERRLLTLRPHGDDWRRRLAGAEASLAPWKAA